MRVKSGLPVRTVRVPFTGGGSVIPDGALVMPGVTQTVNMGLFIPVPTANAGLDAIGVLKGASATANDSVQAGTTWTFAEVELCTAQPLMEVEYDLNSLITCTSAVTTTTMAVTSMENNADCGWFYIASGTGVGQLLFATANTSASATLMTAPSPALDTSSKFVHIKRLGFKTAFISAGTGLSYKFGSQAAAGTYTFLQLENWIDSPANGIPRQLLNPTIHNGLTLKQSSKVTFSVVGVPRLIGGYS